MTAPAVPRETKVASLDDILLELVDIDDNVRDDVGDLTELTASISELGQPWIDPWDRTVERIAIDWPVPL